MLSPPKNYINNPNIEVGDYTYYDDFETVSNFEKNVKYHLLQRKKEAATKTNDIAGDGTTTATVLAEAIFSEGLRAVIAGVRPVPRGAGCAP